MLYDAYVCYIRKTSGTLLRVDYAYGVSLLRSYVRSNHWYF